MLTKNTTLVFMASSFASTLGNSSATVLLPVILLIKTGDPLAAGTLALICGIPQFLAGLAGGAALDRFNRRNISIFSDLISALSIAALPIVEMTSGLSFGWFALFGIIGAVGDIPGMTARDVLFPSLVERDELSLQKFIGLWQALDSLAIIIGPAIASVLIGYVSEVTGLWVTAFLSLFAALVTLFIPASAGKIKEADRPVSPLSTLKDGTAIIFKHDKILTFSVIISAGAIMIISAYQGLLFPVYFTETGHEELLGYVLSMLALGNIIGPLIYSALTDKIGKRTWYVVSFVGVGIGMTVMGLFPSYPIMLAGACFTGIASGPLAALLGFLMIERIPEERRGAVMGLQNAFMLVLPPFFIFIVSALVTALDLRTVSLGCIVALWLVIVYGLATKNMKRFDMDEPDESADEDIRK